MNCKISLNENWSLKEAPLSYKKEMAGYILSDNSGWYTGINIPADVHTPLIDAGVIKDPVLSDYSFDSEWIEQRSWWFKKNFEIAEITEQFYRLVLESLDVHADIFLNGFYLGHHASVFYPFKCDIKKYLVSGVNTLLIRLTSGLEYVNDADLAEVNLKMGTDQGEKRGDNRRVFVRKPAYVYGWDWNSRVATVAIAKDAYIECADGVMMNFLVAETVEIKDCAHIRANLELEVLDNLLPVDADIKAEVLYDGEVKATESVEDKLLCSGINYLCFDFKIENPHIWWPNGMGKQPLYELRVSVDYNGHTDVFPLTRFGIKTIKLDTDKTDEKNRKFVFVVNGQPIFCKGANWVPADSIYARVTDEKYETLIKEAAEANFNMLRIWGGGLYERDAFYDACDKYGILVWHDFMFACASYPDREEFYALVCKELDYQTKRLGGKACLALFCGNNEIHCNPHIFGTFGMKISNIAAPEYVNKNCRWIPYLNSSPYPKQLNPYVGDDHYWDYINMDMPVRIEPKVYDKVQSKFVSEYGYIGPCVKESIEEYFDGQPVDMQSKVWSHHTNIWENDTVKEGIKKHYTDAQLNLDQYLLYAGLVQSMMYQYSLESFRSMDYNGGGLIWMYNDCWGETGWTIIDYYLRRKISFYGVKRALAHVKLILRETDGVISVFGANDTPNRISMNIRYGYTSFDDSFDDSKDVEIHLAPMSKGKLFSFEIKDNDPYSGVFYAKADSGETAVLRYCDLRELNLCLPDVQIVSEYDLGNDRIVEIESRTFAAGVYLDTPSKLCLSDNYFQMLPGEKKRVIIKGGAGVKAEVKTVLVKKKGE